VQGPEFHLKDLGITVACPVEPDQEAVLEVSQRIFVNWETCYVSRPEALDVFLVTAERFAAQPDSFATPEITMRGN
jgi:hypothetical protein